MKKVKFNVAFQYLNHTDEELKKIQDDLKTIRKKDGARRQNDEIKADDVVERKMANPGDIVEITDAQYEELKDLTTSYSVSIKEYYVNHGGMKPESFDMKDAIKHGHVKTEDTMQKVKILELVK